MFIFLSIIIFEMGISGFFTCSANIKEEGNLSNCPFPAEKKHSNWMDNIFQRKRFSLHVPLSHT